MIKLMKNMGFLETQLDSRKKEGQLMTIGFGKSNEIDFYFNVVLIFIRKTRITKHWMRVYFVGQYNMAGCK